MTNDLVEFVNFGFGSSFQTYRFSIFYIHVTHIETFARPICLGLTMCWCCSSLLRDAEARRPQEVDARGASQAPELGRASLPAASCGPEGCGGPGLVSKLGLIELKAASDPGSLSAEGGEDTQ